MTPSFPSSIDSISAEWLTAKLRAAGVLAAGTEVAQVDGNPVAAQGTTSVVARLEVKYSPASLGVFESFAVKLPSAQPEVKAATNATGATIREVNFYRHMMEHGPSPAAPTCYAAEYGRETGEFILLMEDLSGWRTGDVLATSPDDVEALLRAIAPLHALYWNDVELGAARWIVNSNARRAAAISGILAESLPRCRELFPEHSGPRQSRSLNWQPPTPARSSYLEKGRRRCSMGTSIVRTRCSEMVRPELSTGRMFFAETPWPMSPGCS